MASTSTRSTTTPYKSCCSIHSGPEGTRHVRTCTWDHVEPMRPRLKRGLRSRTTPSSSATESSFTEKGYWLRRDVTLFVAVEPELAAERGIRGATRPDCRGRGDARALSARTRPRRLATRAATPPKSEAVPPREHRPGGTRPARTGRRSLPHAPRGRPSRRTRAPRHASPRARPEGHARLERFLPAGRDDTPAIARLEPREHPLRLRRHQVVPR